jgi:hypothetical protein
VTRRAGPILGARFGSQRQRAFRAPVCSKLSTQELTMKIKSKVRAGRDCGGGAIWV